MYKRLKNGINKHIIVYADYNTHNNNKHIKTNNSPGLWPRACYISRNRFLFYFFKKQELKNTPPVGSRTQSQSQCVATSSWATKNMCWVDLVAPFQNTSCSAFSKINKNGVEVGLCPLLAVLGAPKT